MRKSRSPVWKVSVEEFQSIINNSNTIGEVLLYFGLQNIGGNYKTVKNRCEKENISLEELHIRTNIKLITNMTKMNKGNIIPLEEILIENSQYNRVNLKKRLINNNMLENVCAICRINPIWQDQPLVLVLDHINGINNDNRLENLRLLCPNCHSQTDTFAGKKRRIWNTLKDKEYSKKDTCLDCGTIVTNDHKYCSKCAHKRNRKVERPSKEELEEMIKTISWCEIGRIYGVTDNAVRKWARSYELLK